MSTELGPTDSEKTQERKASMWPSAPSPGHRSRGGTRLPLSCPVLETPSPCGARSPGPSESGGLGPKSPSPWSRATWRPGHPPCGAKEGFSPWPLCGPVQVARSRLGPAGPGDSGREGRSEVLKVEEVEEPDG